MRFNSRAHGARDASDPYLDTSKGSFNSRAHGARDKKGGPWCCCFDVSIHARTGRATTGAGLPCQRTRVSIHARTGRATLHRRRFPHNRHVSIHARTGRATIGPNPPAYLAPVSIHARTGRATFRMGGNAPMEVFQFTRARGARQAGDADHRGCRVSIHARTGRATPMDWMPVLMPTFQFTRARGARRGRHDDFHVVQVSIHARTGRATICSAGGKDEELSFNSRAHGARDASPPTPRPRATFQFTRARGARLLGVGKWGCFWGFNSRAHGARDARRAFNCAASSVSIHARTGRATGPCQFDRTPLPFQFTRARGARPRTARRFSCRTGFNSRAHGARDAERALDPVVAEVSIHARTGRATNMAGVNLDWMAFQFTRARGARRWRANPRPSPASFQFTRARGARPPPSAVPAPRLHGFNSRAHGARDMEIPALSAVGPFQFTRARGARR